MAAIGEDHATPPPSVAVVAYTGYGSDPRVRREAEALAESGYEVHVISASIEAPAHPNGAPSVGLHGIPMPIVRGGKARYLYQYAMFSLLSTVLLLRLHAVHRFKVVHVHSLPDFLVFCTLPEKMMGVRVVLDLHEAMPEILAARFRLDMASWWIRLALVLERASSAYADRVVVVSKHRASLAIHRGIAAYKLAVVSNAPDTKGPEPSSAELIRERDKLDGAAVVVEAGGLNPERDLDTLVKAAGMLSTRYRLALLLFGKGDPGYQRELRQLAEKVAPRLDFRMGGWISTSEVAQYLAISEVGLATYQRNPLTEYAAPNKVFECVAAGKPLILANLRTLRADWNGAALFYEPGDPADLAEKIERLIVDKALARRLTEHAAELYRLNDWAVARETLLQVFRELTAVEGG